MGTLIGLVGIPGAGKTTIANYAAEVYEDTKKISMADTLKEVCAEIFGVPVGVFYDNKAKESQYNKEYTYRQILQLIGQTARSIDKNVWVNALKRRICSDDVSNFVVDDVRHPNELGFILGAGGYIFNIVVEGESLSCDHVSDYMAVEFKIKYPWLPTLSAPRGDLDKLRSTMLVEFDKILLGDKK